MAVIKAAKRPPVHDSAVATVSPLVRQDAMRSAARLKNASGNIVVFRREGLRPKPRTGTLAPGLEASSYSRALVALRGAFLLLERWNNTGNSVPPAPIGPLVPCLPVIYISRCSPAQLVERLR